MAAMSKDSENTTPPFFKIGPGGLCERPEEVLQSETFEKFLSLFNRAKTKQAYEPNSTEPWELVIPEDVANNPALAKEVWKFWNREDTVIEAREEERDRMNRLLEATRDYVGEKVKVVMRGNKLVATPPWFLKVYPECDAKLPWKVVRRLKKTFQALWVVVHEEGYGDDATLKSVVCSVMNNFAFTITDLRYFVDTDKIIGHRGPKGYPTSKLMQQQTYRDFFAAVDQALAETGLSIEHAATLNGVNHRLYFLPAFMKLLKRGYNIYPDLSV